MKCNRFCYCTIFKCSSSYLSSLPMEWIRIGNSLGTTVCQCLNSVKRHPSYGPLSFGWDDTKNNPVPLFQSLPLPLKNTKTTSMVNKSHDESRQKNTIDLLMKMCSYLLISPPSFIEFELSVSGRDGKKKCPRRAFA